MTTNPTVSTTEARRYSKQFLLSEQHLLCYHALIYEAGGDLPLMQTSQVLAVEQLDLHNKSSEVCIKTRSLSALLPFKGQAIDHTTVKWSITAGSTRHQR